MRANWLTSPLISTSQPCSQLKVSSVNNTELSTTSKKKRTGSFNFSLKSEIKDRNLKKFLQREWSFIGTDERTPEELESNGKISVPY